MRVVLSLCCFYIPLPVLGCRQMGLWRPLTTTKDFLIFSKSESYNLVSPVLMFTSIILTNPSGHLYLFIPQPTRFRSLFWRISIFCTGNIMLQFYKIQYLKFLSWFQRLSTDCFSKFSFTQKGILLL